MSDLRPSLRRSTVVVLVLAAMSLALLIWAALTREHSDHRMLENTMGTSDLAFVNVYVNSPDIKRLGKFYKEVFGVQALGSAETSALTGAAASVHSMPGYAGPGPYLTLMKADSRSARGPLRVFDRGYAHLCFESDDVNRITRLIEANGGTLLSTFSDIPAAAAIYARDPDGNAVEVHIPLPEPLTPWTLVRTMNSLARTYFKWTPAEDSRIRFLHVNINSTDWKRTVKFYQESIGAVPTGIERNYDGDFIVSLTGVANAEVHGRHVALPGYSPGGPTFEIFTYNKPSTQGPLTLSDIGVVATGFVARDLKLSVARIVAAGGAVDRQFSEDMTVVRDKDGNQIVMRQR